MRDPAGALTVRQEDVKEPGPDAGRRAELVRSALRGVGRRDRSRRGSSRGRAGAALLRRGARPATHIS